MPIVIFLSSTSKLVVSIVVVVPLTVKSPPTTTLLVTDKVLKLLITGAVNVLLVKVCVSVKPTKALEGAVKLVPHPDPVLNAIPAPG